MKLVEKKREFDIDRILVHEPTNDQSPPGRIIWRTPLVRLIQGAAYRHQAELIVGKHEISNRLHSGRATAVCRVVAMTDQEFNFCRHADLLAPVDFVPDTADAALDILEWLNTQLEPYATELKANRVGRPPLPKPTLRNLLGLQRGTARGALAQAALRRKNAKENGTARPKLASELETFGLELEEDTVANISSIQSTLYHASGSVSSLKKTLLALRLLPFPGETHGQIMGTVRELERLLDGARPASLCTRCKGIERIQERCDRCKGFGWTSVAQNKTEEPRLLDTVEPVVMYGGMIKPMHEFLYDPGPDEPPNESFAEIGIPDEPPEGPDVQLSDVELF
jgi:hypothetical protein